MPPPSTTFDRVARRVANSPHNVAAALTLVSITALLWRLLIGSPSLDIVGPSHVSAVQPYHPSGGNASVIEDVASSNTTEFAKHADNNAAHHAFSSALWSFCVLTAKCILAWRLALTMRVKQTQSAMARLQLRKKMRSIGKANAAKLASVLDLSSVEVGEEDVDDEAVYKALNQMYMLNTQIDEVALDTGSANSDDGDDGGENEGASQSGGVGLPNRTEQRKQLVAITVAIETEQHLFRTICTTLPMLDGIVVAMNLMLFMDALLLVLNVCNTVLLIAYVHTVYNLAEMRKDLKEKLKTT